MSQCVEYYYIWKKKPKFDYSRAQVIEKKVKRAKDEVEETEKKVEKLLGICARCRPSRKTPSPAPRGAAGAAQGELPVLNNPVGVKIDADVTGYPRKTIPALRKGSCW